jgi:hypothetical protein
MTEKHVLWFVPNYDASTLDGVAKTHPVSYLRLGSMSTTVDELSTAELRGDDLLERAGPGHPGFFGDPEDPSTAPFFDEQNSGEPRNQEEAGSTYQRLASGAEAEHSTSRNLTAELMTRGGWRDHTDGNRISTTRGDRVDFVFGNFRRVVFGRQAASSPITVATFDLSGGHIRAYDDTPRAITSISWTQDSDGTWKVVDESNGANSSERYRGRSRSHYDGQNANSTIGVPQAHADGHAAAEEGAMVGLFAGMLAVVGASCVASFAQASAGNAPGAAAAASPLVIALPIFLPATAATLGAVVAAAVDATPSATGGTGVDDSTNPVIREQVWAASSIEEIEVSGDVSESTTAERTISDVTYVGRSAESVAIAKTRIDSTGRADRPVSLTVEATFAKKWVDFAAFDRRRLVDVGGLTLGLSLVAAEEHVYGNAEDGPWGPSGPCPAVSLDLSMTRKTSLGAEVSFFMGTKMDLTVGNGLELSLQAMSHELEGAMKVEVRNLSEVSSNFKSAARLIRLCRRLHRLTVGPNFHS